MNQRVIDIIMELIAPGFPSHTGEPVWTSEIVTKMYVLGYTEEDVELIKGNVSKLYFDTDLQAFRIN